MLLFSRFVDRDYTTQLVPKLNMRNLDQQEYPIKFELRKTLMNSELINFSKTFPKYDKSYVLLLKRIRASDILYILCIYDFL